ncbi:alcohol oxidase [Morchella conica CCBAS932]|uniref:Alcohol oxidase n=1 Tax=Morchella conica CCBAS932 TaxID=1392247 RepID=A0A3N4L444_9PEZI|nr:alcohol oxidase [Morchella conica CCBAS932]
MLLHLVISLSITGSAFAAPFLGQLLERQEQVNGTYDYIIAGGGTAGLAVANRLTEDPKISVLVLEAGIPDQKECAAILQRCLGDTMRSKYDWNVTTEPQMFLSGRPQNLAIGRALGGSSMLNGMMFDRGSPSDYDMWEQLGNPGWGWKGILPYFKKSETFTPPNADHVQEFGITYDPEVHGDSGYIQSGYPNFIFPQMKNFQDALMSLGIVQSKDQAGRAIGTFWSPNTIDPKNMTRSYSRSAYYDNFTNRTNLHVITSRHVTKLLLDKDRVTGVEYIEVGKNTTYTVAAKREYIVSAGTIHTPQLLQLSGIGQKSLLEGLGIPVVVDLPGVGQNFQDHPFATLSLKLDNVEHSLWDLDRNATYDAEQKALFYADREGAWTTGGPNSVAFLPLSSYTNQTTPLLTSYANAAAAAHLRNDTPAAVIAGFTAQRSILLSHLATPNTAAMEFIWQSGAARRYQMPFSVSVQHPFSRGHVEINSTNPLLRPIVDLRTGSNPVDLTLLVEAFRYARRVVATDAIQELVPTELLPGANVTSDEDILAYAKSSASTMFHPSGTSAMMPRELGGVVDSSLRVYGVKNLRVVDASIIPLIPATHIVSTVYAIAEKAADLIKAAQK